MFLTAGLLACMKKWAHHREWVDFGCIADQSNELLTEFPFMLIDSVGHDPERSFTCTERDVLYGKSLHSVEKSFQGAENRNASITKGEAIAFVFKANEQNL
jgi:hypothetical protein